MNSVSTLDELERAVAAAGYAMAAQDDETEFLSAKTVGDSVARGARVPAVTSVMAALPAPTSRRVDRPNSFITGAQTVRETVFGYLGLATTA